MANHCGKCKKYKYNKELTRIHETGKKCGNCYKKDTIFMVYASDIACKKGFKKRLI